MHSDIDCRYCHNSIDNSKEMDLPKVNVCINCHSTMEEDAALNIY
ncbi:MAG: hypothetical protein HRT57_00495 [Crocinitomicaceae bacterium]|nr:hypothetical protein [Crocinitomicaceae bacterium]